MAKNSKDNDWKDRLNVVYSTNPDFKYEVDDDEEQTTPQPSQQRLRVQLDRKNRGGTVVTLITGFVGMLFGMGFGGTVLYSGIGLVVFMLLTAYDTQKLRQIYAYYAGDAELAEKASIYGALTLYLDFINIFLYVVRLLGMNSRSRNN